MTQDNKNLYDVNTEQAQKIQNLEEVLERYEEEIKDKIGGIVYSDDSSEGEQNGESIFAEVN